MRSPWIAVPAVLVLLGLGTVSGATAAAAEDPAGTFTFTEPTVTVEYGENWRFDFTSNYPVWAADPLVTSAGTPPGWWPGYYTYGSSDYTKIGAIGSFYGVAWLEPGSYSFGISTNSDLASGMYATSNTAKLTVVPAVINVDLRVLADPSSPENAIVTAALQGKLVDASSPDYYGETPVPELAGTWTFTIEDSAGNVVNEHTVERLAGDRVFATSYYWSEAKPGESYTASATFDTADNPTGHIAVTPAKPFSYTAPEGRVIEPAAGEPDPPAQLPTSSGFSVPMWWAVLIGIALAALTGFVVFFAIRLGSSPQASKEQS